MTARATLWRRRVELVHRSGALRDRLAVHGAALQPAFGVAEQALGTGRWLRAHPWVPAVVALWLALRRPRQTLGWGMKLFRGGRWMWRMARVWQGLR